MYDMYLIWNDPHGISDRILSYRCRTGRYICKVSLQHRMVDVVSTAELHGIDPTSAAISALHQNAVIETISNGIVTLGFVDGKSQIYFRHPMVNVVLSTELWTIMKHIVDSFFLSFLLTNMSPLVKLAQKVTKGYDPSHAYIFQTSQLRLRDSNVHAGGTRSQRGHLCPYYRSRLCPYQSGPAQRSRVIII